MANPAALHVLNLRSASVPGIPLEDVGIDFAATESSPIAVCARTGEAFDDQVATIVASQGRRWLSCNGRPIADDGAAAVVVTITDITERHRETARLEWDANRFEWQAFHDDLTDLLNRAGTLTAIGEHLQKLSAPEDCVAVHYVDLDGFGMINDGLGRAVGDDILTTIGGRLRDALGHTAAVGRLGGDDFVVVELIRDDLRDRLDHQAARIRDAIDQPIALDGRTERVSASIGVAVARHGADHPAPLDLLRDAEIALYEARTNTTVRPYAWFRPHYRSDRLRRQRIEYELRNSVKSDPGQLYFDYHPVVDVGRGHERVALEALMRWRHPKLGQVSPGEFITIARRSDLIEQLGAHLVDTTMREFVDNQATTDGLVLSLNFTRRELADRHFVPRLQLALGDSGLVPSRLCVEISERDLAAGDAKGIKATMTSIRDLGCEIAVDDFGTGGMGLSDLYQMPITTVKTAKAFVDEMEDGAADEADRAELMVTGIASAAHALGITVVAEGVETSRQAAAIERAGCDFAQGFFYAFPQRLVDID
ncbi:sensor domain-containing protein [Gordonia mangrovi]|nr:bifunctional diguanylate cyclase/phosphodiesterase [Gordonia mangrovi]UVF80801.1 bifunctional diguanylate cyclase/phosphodiesterase [Gordonia mangrovi]